MAKGAIRIDMLGASFTIRSDEDPLYLNALLSRYQTVIDTTRRTTGVEDPLKLSILAGLMLCDDLERARGRKDSVPQEGDAAEAERLTLDLIARIDEALGEES